MPLSELTAVQAKHDVTRLFLSLSCFSLSRNPLQRKAEISYNEEFQMGKKSQKQEGDYDQENESHIPTSQ
jgi:hypothetical protein